MVEKKWKNEITNSLFLLKKLLAFFETKWLKWIFTSSFGVLQRKLRICFWEEDFPLALG